MTLSGIGGAKQAAALQARHTGHYRHAVGDHVRLEVVRRLDERRYLVAFRDGQRVVDSSVPLTAGSIVRAAVTAVGEKLELRYVSADPVAMTMEDHAALGEDALARLERHHSVELSESERIEIRQAMLVVEQPEMMAYSGMFLAKLSLPVGAESLHAVYSTQTWSAPVAASTAASGRSAVAEESGAGIERLAARIDAALNPEAAAASADESGSDAGSSEGERDLAQRLLNEQDDGSLTYRYGVLPMLIGDELVELDLVCFRERREAERATGLRRLVMTFATPALGRVQVLAQALGDRLSIGIKTQSARATETLVAHSGQVRELAARLGWNVEAVSYELDAGLDPAGRQLVDHVLSADTLSRLV